MVVVAVVVALGALVVVVAAATFSPWPYEAAATGVGAVCGALVAAGADDPALGLGAGGLVLCALLVLKTVKQTLDETSAARRAARPRRRGAEQAATRARSARERDAA